MLTPHSFQLSQPRCALLFLPKNFSTLLSLSFKQKPSRSPFLPKKSSSFSLSLILSSKKKLFSSFLSRHEGETLSLFHSPFLPKNHLSLLSFLPSPFHFISFLSKRVFLPFFAALRRISFSLFFPLSLTLSSKKLSSLFSSATSLFRSCTNPFSLSLSQPPFLPTIPATLHRSPPSQTPFFPSYTRVSPFSLHSPFLSLSLWWRWKGRWRRGWRASAAGGLERLDPLSRYRDALPAVARTLLALELGHKPSGRGTERSTPGPVARHATHATRSLVTPLSPFFLSLLLSLYRETGRRLRFSFSCVREVYTCFILVRVLSVHSDICMYVYVYIYIYCLLEDFQGGCAKWVNFWKSVEIRFWGFEERERERVYASELILWHFGRVGWVWIARTGQGRAVTQALATAFGGLSFIRVFLSRASSLLITRYLQ